MIIECPSCRFRRDVPDASIRPGKKYKVTCPRCSSVFHFSLPEEEAMLEGEPLQREIYRLLTEYIWETSKRI